MFELLGIVDLSGKPVPWKLSLPATRWLPGSRFRWCDVLHESLKAAYVCHPLAPESYAFQEGKHLFVVGEVYPKSNCDSVFRHLVGPLSATNILKRSEADEDRFTNSIKGNFVLVFIDSNKRYCRLFNGHSGMLPFYYALDGTRFIFSTSLSAAGNYLLNPPELDQVAIAEMVIFNHPLKDRTYYQQVKMLQPAEIVCTSIHGLSHKRWWDARSLLDAPLYSKNEALELGSDLFARTVNSYAVDIKRVRVSFTSGFDSRAILAVLNKDPSEILAYSFGTPGSLNVSIPIEICEQQRIPFYPIYLEQEYEKVFDEYALRALWLSDGLSTVERANYPYAFEKLADFSPVVLTGLFGSELMRTFQNVGYVVNANLVRLNTAQDACQELRTLWKTPETWRYFRADFFSRNLEEVIADLKEAWLDRFGDLSPDQRLYMFLLSEGLRKYFGAEIQMERPWGINRFPFLDDDFVEFAFRAPFAGVHSQTLTPTIENRFQSQYFYAYVIRKYRPKLLTALTDHGYAPRDVLGPLPLLRLGPQYAYWRWRRKRNHYQEFKTEEWTEKLYQRLLFSQAKEPEFFSPLLRQDFENGAWKLHRLDFARAASFKLWLEMQD